MPDPQSIFNAIKSVGLKLDSLDKESLKDLTKLVNIARKEVINRLANKPTEYQAWKYSQTKADLDRILAELDRTLKTKMTGFIEQSWDLGIEQVDEPLKAAEIFGMIPDINTNILTTFKDFSADLITNLTDEARRKIENAIKIGILAGDPIDKIAKQIGTNLENRSIFKSIRTRAVTIGRTEINRIFNYSNDLRYDEALKVIPDLAQMWVAAMDSRTRFSHRVADGQITQHGEPFKVGGYEAQFPGDPALPAKESVNCFIGETLVLAAKIQRAFCRFYDGELVTIKTSSGNELTGTPNHPILTDKGWVALGTLKNRDNVICYSKIRKRRFFKPDVNSNPAMIKEIYAAFSCLFPVKRISLGNMDFHGDGEAGYVYIVDMIGKLLSTINSFFRKHFSKLSFVFANILSCFLMSFCSGNKLCFASNFASNGSVSFSGKSLSFLWRGLPHSKIHSLRSISRFNFAIFKNSINNITGNGIFNRKRFYGSTVFKFVNNRCRQFYRFIANFNIIFPKSLINKFPSYVKSSSNRCSRFTRHITVDYVVDVSRRKVNAPTQVFNLQTKNGWYVANNIISHNCRCRIIPYKEDWNIDWTKHKIEIK